MTASQQWRRRLAAAALVLAASCGGTAPPAPVAEKPKPVEIFHVDAATAGTLRGEIKFDGVAPPPKLIDMESDASCVKANGGKPVYEQPILAGKTGGLANVFVYIDRGLEGKKFEPVTEPVLFSQHGCMFEPRVFGMRAGENMEVKNDDPVSHNIHPRPKNNYDWNEQQSPGAPDMFHKFPRADVMIPVKCNVHAWMRAFIGVVDHPYFAVTAANGAFELKNVPPGDYTLAIWHEKLGQQKQTVHLAPSATAAVNFTYR